MSVDQYFEAPLFVEKATAGLGFPPDIAVLKL
jgi:hypothetical protein